MRVAVRLPEGRRPRLALAAAAVIVVAAAGFGVVAARGGRGPEATVRAFFAARRDGDCERLRDLVSEASWSSGSRLDRDGFVAACDRVVEHYRPQLGDVEIASDDGERAVVTVSVPFDQTVPTLPGDEEGFVVFDRWAAEPHAYATGTLVREDGGWKVETDIGLLRLGRSPGDTVRAYMEALVAGRCEDAAALLSRAAWSATGASDPDGFVEQCAASTEPSAGLVTGGLLPAFEVVREGEQVTAVAETSEETIRLVQDGLAWKLDRELAGAAALRLRALVVEPPAEGYTADQESVIRPDAGDYLFTLFDYYEGTAATERRHDAGFERGLIVTFARGDDQITVVLYQFAEPEGARTYAQQVADRVVKAADSRAPAPSGPPDLADPAAGTFAMPTRCGDGDGCSTATETVAVGAHDGFMVAVQASDYVDDDPPTAQLVDQARQVLQAQIERLP